MRRLPSSHSRIMVVRCCSLLAVWRIATMSWIWTEEEAERKDEQKQCERGWNKGRKEERDREKYGTEVLKTLDRENKMNVGNIGPAHPYTCQDSSRQTLALAGSVLISWMRKVSGLTMMTRGMPVVCCTQHTRPGWFITSDHWHNAGDVLLPPLELKR